MKDRINEIKSAIIDNNNIIDFDANVFLSALNGLINITIPSIKPVLHIIEPTAFPKLIVAWLSIDANNDTVNSGNVVAKLTIVAPKINSEILVFLPISTVAFIKKSAPFEIKIKPITNKTTTITILIPPIYNKYS